MSVAAAITMMYISVREGVSCSGFLPFIAIETLNWAPLTGRPFFLEI